MTSLDHWPPEQTPGVPALRPACHCTAPESLGGERALPWHSSLWVLQAISASTVTVVTSCSPLASFRSPICCPQGPFVLVTSGFHSLCPADSEDACSPRGHSAQRAPDAEVARGGFFHLHPLFKYFQNLETIKAAQWGPILLNQSAQAVVFAGLMLPWAACFVTARSCVWP